MQGRWFSIAISCARRCFFTVIGKYVPPLTVASFATTTQGRPCIGPMPVTMPARGRLVVVEVRRPPSGEHRGTPRRGRGGRSIRSRASSLPALHVPRRRRLTAAGPRRSRVGRGGRRRGSRIAAAFAANASRAAIDVGGSLGNGAPDPTTTPTAFIGSVQPYRQVRACVADARDRYGRRRTGGSSGHRAHPDRGAPRGRSAGSWSERSRRTPRRSIVTTRSLVGSGRSSATSGCSVRPCPRPTAAPAWRSSSISSCVEELSRGSASVGLSYAAHSNLCVHNLWAARHRPSSARGGSRRCSRASTVGALAMSEADAGSDVLGSMRCRAERVDGGWRRERHEDVDHERAGRRRARSCTCGPPTRSTGATPGSRRSSSSAAWRGSARRPSSTSSGCGARARASWSSTTA